MRRRMRSLTGLVRPRCLLEMQVWLSVGRPCRPCLCRTLHPVLTSGEVRRSLLTGEEMINVNVPRFADVSLAPLFSVNSFYCLSFTAVASIPRRKKDRLWDIVSSSSIVWGEAAAAENKFWCAGPSRATAVLGETFSSRGHLWRENFWIVLFKLTHSGVLCIFERRRRVFQTSRGPG